MDKQNLYATAERLFQLGKSFMEKQQYKNSFQAFRESASRFIMMAQQETEKNIKVKIKEVAIKAIANAEEARTKMEEQKTNMKEYMNKSLNQHPKIIGFNLTQSQEYFSNMGEYYYQRTKAEDKAFFCAAKACYIIAAENLHKLISLTPDQEKQTEMKQKLSKMIQLQVNQLSIEGLTQISQEKIEFDQKKMFMSKYKEHEKAIIEKGNHIGNKQYELWDYSKGIVNIFSGEMYTDPDGLLPLSQKQMKKFYQWRRPFEFFAEHLKGDRISIADRITGYEIQQRQVGDCSVLSSLAVGAHQEFKWKHQKRLISSIIYPQDHNGNPLYNPYGKYVIKLFLNGHYRAVTIDDYFPCTEYMDPLFAHSDKGQLWVSLIEKAYLKVHGGYDFMGSNSSRDLYTLTGWLPEKIELKMCDKNKTWSRISQGTKNNDCLLTIGTGMIPDEDRIGLVSNHAYGVLEVFEYGQMKILLVKNPWGSFTWKGKYSSSDKVNWTPELRKFLHVQDLENLDNGIFWIDFDSVCEWFDFMDVNWNPELLVYKKSVFDIWKSIDMIQDDFNMSHNPQFSVQFINDGPGESILAWIVLSKMIVNVNGLDEEEEKASSYLALHVYPNNKPGKLVCNENIMVRSVYTNEQNYILYLDLKKENYFKLNKVLNLVLSQYMRSKDLYYNISIHSSCPFELIPAHLNYEFSQQIQVKQEIGGGPPNSPHFYSGPQFGFLLDKEKINNIQQVSSIKILLRYQTTDASEIKLFLSKANPKFSRLTSTGNVVHDSIRQTHYRPGFNYIEFNLQPSESYTVLVSTFQYKQFIQGMFMIDSNHPLKVFEIPEEGKGMKKIQLQGEWDSITSGGCRNFGMYDKNPAYVFDFQDDCEIIIRLRTLLEMHGVGHAEIDIAKLKFSINAALYGIYASTFPPKKGSIDLTGLINPVCSTNENVYSSTQSMVVTSRTKITKGVYVLIPATFNPQESGKFEITMYSNSAFVDSFNYQ